MTTTTQAKPQTYHERATALMDRIACRLGPVVFEPDGSCLIKPATKREIELTNVWYSLAEKLAPDDGPQ